MLQTSMESYKIGKVKVERLTPNIYKMVCSLWIRWSTGEHFEKAIVELSKKHKILCIYSAPSLQNYLIVIVE